MYVVEYMAYILNIRHTWNKSFIKINLILDAPVCKKQQNEAFGVARQELVLVQCDVMSDPMENLKFEWIFSKGDEKLDMQQSQIR